MLRIAYTFFGVSLLAANFAHGVTVVTNLANAQASSWIIGSGSTVTNAPVANQFTTGSGSNWNLNSVSLRLGLFSGQGLGTINVFLAADDAGVPGANLVALTGAAPTTVSEILLYTPVSAQVLSPNTNYWLVASSSLGGSDGYLWWFTSDTTESGLPGWSIANTAYAAYPSGSWTPLVADDPNLFQVEATAVPEPTVGLLVALTLLGSAACRRRKKLA